MSLMPPSHLQEVPKADYMISTNEFDRLVMDELRPPCDFQSIVWYRWGNRQKPYEADADPAYLEPQPGLSWTFDFGVSEFIRTGESRLASAGDLLSELARRGRIRKGHYRIWISH